MADVGIKKVTISTADFGTVSSLNTYSLRYRIVSEDKNRSSHWSPLYEIFGNVSQLVPGDLNVIGNTVIAAWADEVNRPAYDIFVGFNGATPTYHGTTPIHTYSFLKESLATTVRVIVQINSISKTLSETLEIYDSAESGEGQGDLG